MRADGALRYFCTISVQIAEVDGLLIIYRFARIGLRARVSACVFQGRLHRLSPHFISLSPFLCCIISLRLCLSVFHWAPDWQATLRILLISK